MTTASPTLRDLFTGEVDLAGAPALRALRRGLTPPQWRRLCVGALDVLDVHVIDLLIGGWRHHAGVRAQLRTTADDPSRTAVVQVAEHTVESSHKPSLEVRMHRRLVATVTLALEIGFEVEGVALTIRGGDIREVRPGRVSARGTMALESTVILERALAAITLPGRLVIPAGHQPPAPRRPVSLSGESRAVSRWPVFG